MMETVITTSHFRFSLTYYHLQIFRTFVHFLAKKIYLLS